MLLAVVVDQTFTSGEVGSTFNDHHHVSFFPILTTKLFSQENFPNLQCIDTCRMISEY